MWYGDPPAFTRREEIPPATRPSSFPVLSPCREEAEVRSASWVASNRMKPFSAQKYGALRQGYRTVLYGQHWPYPYLSSQCNILWQLEQRTSHFAISSKMRSLLNPRLVAWAIENSFAC